MGAAVPPKPDPAFGLPPAPKKSMRERIDPRNRSVDGIDNAVRLSKKDPDRSYVWVNERPVASMTGGDVGFYKNMAVGMGLEDEDGYRVEVISRDGVVAHGAMSIAPGDTITNSYGQVLMSCPVEFKRLVEAIGTNGVSGQEEADRLNALMISRRNLADHMRGIGRPGMFNVVPGEDHGESRPINYRTQ
jgi:hypothetical protein